MLRMFSNYANSLAMPLQHFHKQLLYVSMLMVLCWLSVVSNAHAESPSILFVIDRGKPLTEQIFKSFKSQSVISMYKTQVIDYLEIDKATTHNYQLIVTLGSRPARSILAINSDTPVLNLLITEQSFKSFRQQYQDRNNWSALVVNQPLRRQIVFSRNLLGNEITFGFLLGPYSSEQLSSITDIANELAISIAVENIDNEAALIPSIKSLINNSGMILSLPDPVAFNRKTIRGILLISYRNNIPVIGFSKSYVKSGALAAIYSSSEQISLQASEIIVNFINNREFKQPLSYPRYYSIATNGQVARALGINMKSDSELLELTKDFEQAK